MSCWRWCHGWWLEVFDHGTWNPEASEPSTWTSECDAADQCLYPRYNLRIIYIKQVVKQLFLRSLFPMVPILTDTHPLPLHAHPLSTLAPALTDTHFLTPLMTKQLVSLGNWIHWIFWWGVKQLWAYSLFCKLTADLHINGIPCVYLN